MFFFSISEKNNVSNKKEKLNFEENTNNLNLDLVHSLKDYINFIIQSEFLIELNKISFFYNKNFSIYENFVILRSGFYQAVVNEESLKKSFIGYKNVNSDYLYLIISRFSKKGYEAFDLNDLEYELKPIETL